MARDDEIEHLFRVRYRLHESRKVNMDVEFSITAPNMVMAISRSAEPLFVLFTEEGRQRLELMEVVFVG